MINPTSRYAAVDTATLIENVDGESRSIRYFRRRFVPPTTGLVSLLKHPVKQGDRVDNLATLYFTDPLQFWRICDTNNVLDPDELVQVAGKLISIVLPLR
jgi:hypothetical protein